MQVVHFFGDRTLNTINKKIVEAGSFLRRLKDEPQNLESLDAFAESHNVIAWIQEETRGM